MKASSFFSYFFGALFILGGLIFFGFSMGFYTLNTGFENWWTLCIGGAGLLLMFIFGADIFNSLIYFAGLGLVLYENGYVLEENKWILLITMAIMAIGVSFTGIAYKHYSPFEKKSKELNKINPKINAFATKKHIKNTFNGVGGSTLKNLKSDVVYDVSDAIVDDGAIINVKTTFGKTYLVFPSGYDIALNILGNKKRIFNHLTSSDANGRKIAVNGKVSFGKIYIMNSATSAPILDLAEEKV